MIFKIFKTNSSHKQLNNRKKAKQQKLNQTDDLKFKKFREDLAKNKQMLNSTACSPFNRSLKSSEPNTTASSISPEVEEGEIITKDEVSLRTENNTANNISDDECLLIEEAIDPIIVDDDTPIEDNKTVPNFFEDVSGDPTLIFKAQQQERSSTAVMNSSDVIILDETCCSVKDVTLKKKNKSTSDDSVIFVSETPAGFIPLTSANTKQQSVTVPNPFSPKIKRKTQNQSSNDTLFTKSELKQLKNYNSNTYNPNYDEKRAAEKSKSKRMVIIDGSNVAYGHSRQREFSVKGLEICIEYFVKMGHEVKAVVPQMRLKVRNSTDPATLERLYKEGIVVLTPCKNLPGASSSSYDDRFILQLALQLDAAIVSNDNYRDFVFENPILSKLIHSRVIGYTWIGDLFMVPVDPYGKNGIKLQEILNRKLKTPKQQQ